MNKRFLITTLLLCIFLTIMGQSRSFKRGLSFNALSQEDLSVLSPGVSWLYNWSIQPPTTIRDNYENYNEEFVPMAWSGWYNKTQLRVFLTAHPSVKYILAFNEPNFKNQANMTPSAAAAAWPELEAIADEFHLKIVSPAVNYSGDGVTENGVVYNNPVTYLEDFFKACPTCRVDYIATHFYMPSADALKSSIEQFRKFNKPIWLTEFCMDNGTGNNGTVDDQIRFMTESFAYLEKEPMIFRYSWFMARTGTSVINVLSPTSGVLNDLGQVFVNMSSFDSTYFFAIEDKIPAVQYIDAKGIVLEKTDDTFGKINVKDMGEFDYTEYLVDVKEAGDYYLGLRLACNNSTSIEVYSNGQLLGTYSVPTTGGLTSWGFGNVSIKLPAGKQHLKIRSMGRIFRLSWLKISKDKISSLNPINDLDIRVSPNPVENILNIVSDTEISKVEIYSISGKLVFSGHNTNQIDMQNFSNGMYLIKLHLVDNSFVFRRIIKK